MRRHLFEFGDLPWLPRRLREGITGYLELAHRLIGTNEPIAAILAPRIAATGSPRIIDCCSGAGGPQTRLVTSLRDEHGLDVETVLTDLYPPAEQVQRINANGNYLKYEAEPIDAANLPERLSGFRTLICGFHHLAPREARTVLEDAFDKRQPIAIFEITENSWPAFVAISFVPLIALGVVPLIRPMRFAYLLLTYVVPVLPLVVFWDGLVSSLRTYSLAELQELIEDLRSEDYQWELGRLEIPNVPYGPPYLIGTPAQRMG